MPHRRTPDDAGFVLPDSANSSKKRHISYDSSDNSTLPLPSPSASPTHSNSNNHTNSHTNPGTNNTILALNSSATTTTTTTTTNNTNTPCIITNDQIKTFISLISNKNNHSLLLKILENTNTHSLSNLYSTLNILLRKDILSYLPPEITFKILSQFNYKNLCNCLEVSHKWNDLISSYPELWKNILLSENLITIDDYNFEFKKFNSLNIYDFNKIPKLIYERRFSIKRRWMDLNYKPKTYTLLGDSLNVITCLQFDYNKIAAGSNASQILIYNTETGNLLNTLHGHTGGVWAMKFFNNTLASGSTDRTVRIWNLKYGICTHIFRGHTSTVRCLEIIEPKQIGTDDEGNPIIYPKTPLLITGSRDTTLYVWKLPILNDNDPIPKNPIDLDAINNPNLLKILKGHSASVRAVTGYANILISGSYDSTARVWDIRTGECKWILRGHSDKIYSCVYDVKRNTCYTGSVDTTVRIWDLNTGKTISILEGHQILVGLITLSNNVLVSAAADSTVRIWDPNSGQSKFVLRGHSSAITCVDNDDYKVISGSQGMLKLWNAQTGEFVRDLVDDVDGAVWQVAFDYRRCISAVQKNDDTFIEVCDFCPPETDKWLYPT